MSNTAIAEGHPWLRDRALRAFMLTLGVLSLPLEAFAQSHDIKFNGELSYAAFRSAASRGQTVTIRYSPGGTGAAALALARVSKVVVDGPCNSACAWSFVRNANACFTPRAKFGFHAAHDPGTGRRLNAATAYWLQGVRPSLKGKLGGLLSTSSLIKISATEMRRYYGDRVCSSEPRAEIAALETQRPIAKAALRTPKSKFTDRKPDEIAAAAKNVTAVLSLQPDLVAAVALLHAEESGDTLVREAEGALPMLLTAGQWAESGAGWQDRELLAFSKVMPGIIMTAQNPEEGDATPRSISLLYRRDITVA